MPTIDKRFLLKLTLATLALIGAVAGVHTIQAGRIPQALKTQSERAADADKMDKAIHYLRRYLEFVPTDVEAQVRLAGFLKNRTGDPSDLLLLYDKILRADPERNAIRREALIVSLRIGRFGDAETHAEVLLKSSPQDAELWQNLAAAQAGLQKTSEARKSYETAVSCAPDQVIVYQRLAQYLWRDLERPTEARAVVDRLVAALPKEPDAYMTRVRFTLLADEPGKPADPAKRAVLVLPDLRKVLEIQPNHADAILACAEQLQYQRELAEARDLLAHGIDKNPQDQRLVRALAWLELNRGNIGAALGVLEDGLQRSSDGVDLLVPLADLLVQLGDTARSEEILAKVEKRTTREAKLQASYLKARLAMRKGNWSQACELLTQLRTDSVNLPGLERQTNLLLATCYRQRGEVVKEQETLKLLLNQDPTNLSGRTALALSYLDEGAISAAIKEYEIAVRSPYATHATHAALLKLKAREPLAIPTKTVDFVQLDRLVDEAARLTPPGSSDTVLLKAELLVIRGELGQTMALLRSATTERPGDVRLWAALAETTADRHGTTAGIGIADEAQAVLGDGPDVRLLRASLSARDPSGLRPVDPAAANIEIWPDADQTRFLFGLVEIYDRLGDDVKVAKTYRRIAARRPADLGVWLPLGERAARLHDEALFQESRTAAVKLDPTGKITALWDAWKALESDAGHWRPAREALLSAYGPVPDRSDVCLALARLTEKLGETQAAGTQFERAVRLDPTRFPPMRHYLVFLMRNNSIDAAAALMTRLAVDFRWSGEPCFRVVASSMKELSDDKVSQLGLMAAKVLKFDVGTAGRLADLALRRHRQEEAAAFLQMAIESPHVTADDYYRLARLEADRRGPQAGLAVLANAKEKLSQRDHFALEALFAESTDAAMEFSRFRDPAERRLFLQNRFALKLSRYRRDEAADLLERFLKETESPEESAWAERNLALLLAARGSGEDRKRAMELTSKASLHAGATVDEKRSAAALLTTLAGYLDGADRRTVLSRSIVILDKLAAETKAPRDSFLLAQAYRAAGDRESSVAVLNRLNTADPKNLDFHLMALEDLTEMNQFDAAAQFAKRLMMFHGTDFRVVRAVGRFECRAGRPEVALTLAEDYVRTADAQAGDLQLKSTRAAELLDEWSRLPNVRGTETAAKMIRSCVDKYEDLLPVRPEAAVAAAGVLAAGGRREEAFALIEKQSSRLPNRLRAASGLAILRAGELPANRLEQVAEWHRLAVAEDPESLALRLAEAELQTLKQDYTKAELLYREILKRDPRNRTALNNLAWILSPKPESATEALDLLDRAAAEGGTTGEILDTRARVRIAAKQFESAEKDLLEALTREKTPLRMFHLALARDGRSGKSEARQAFRDARTIGLDSKAVHPADLPTYRNLESETRDEKTKP